MSKKNVFVTIILRECLRAGERDGQYKASKMQRSVQQNINRRARAVFFTLYPLCSAFRRDREKERGGGGPVKENDSELNKSVSVQGMPPCMTLLRERRGRTQRRKKEGEPRWMPRRGLQHKAGWGDKQAVAFPLACAHWIPLSPCLLTGLTLASV